MWDDQTLPADSVTILERMFEGSTCIEATHDGNVLRLVFSKGKDVYAFATSTESATLQFDLEKKK